MHVLVTVCWSGFCHGFCISGIQFYKVTGIILIMVENHLPGWKVEHAVRTHGRCGVEYKGGVESVNMGGLCYKV